jgi:hypothetical protein
MRSVEVLTVLSILLPSVLGSAVASDGESEPSLPQSLKLGVGYWHKHGEKSMIGGWRDSPGVPPVTTFEERGSFDGPVWTLTGEYRFHTRWAVEASYSFGQSGAETAYWDIGKDGLVDETGIWDDDYQQYHLNLFLTVFHWRSRNGNTSHLDLGLGYQHFGLDYTSRDWSGVPTWHMNHTETNSGIQLGLRGSISVASRFDLMMRLFSVPDLSYEEEEHSSRIGVPGSERDFLGSGSGEGWDGSLSLVYRIKESLEVELGYRYQNFEIDDWVPDASNEDDYWYDLVEQSHDGFFARINYRFGFSQ